MTTAVDGAAMLDKRRDREVQAPGSRDVCGLASVHRAASRPGVVFLGVVPQSASLGPEPGNVLGPECNPYDLYSKSHEPPNVKALKPYYDDLIAEYFPKQIAW